MTVVYNRLQEPQEWENVMSEQLRRSRARTAISLRDGFNVTQAKSYFLADFVESVKVGDQIVEALRPLETGGDLDKALNRLHAVRVDFDTAVAALEVAFRPLIRREPPK
jgi:hypothetical protein